MATTRFCKPNDNRMWKYDPTALTPAIVNGDEATYPGAPALKQDPQFPMSNLLVPGIYGSPWDTGPPSGTVELVVEIPPVAVALVAFLNIRSPIGPVGSFTFQQSADFWGPPTWTQTLSASLLGLRHQGFIIGTPQVARFVRIVFGNPYAQRFSIGAIYAGAIPWDLGIVYSPGATNRMVPTTIPSRNGAGHLQVTTVGDSRRLVSLPLRNVTDTLKSKVDNVFGEYAYRDPALWIDQNNVVRPVVLSESLEWTHVWAPPNLWETTLQLEALG